MKRLYIETALLTAGLLMWFAGGFYLIHQIDVAVKTFIMSTVK